MPARASAKLVEAGHPAIRGITNHSLRRTFASLLYAAGADPRYVMDQMGHESAGLALEVYAKMMVVPRGTTEKIDALIRDASPELERARKGAKGHAPVGMLTPAEEKSPASQGF